MSFLETMVADPMAAAVGWALVHSLWEGAIVSIALAAVMVATRSPRVRYVAGCVALVAVLLGFAFTLARLAPWGANGGIAVKTAAVQEWEAGDWAGGEERSHAPWTAVVPWLTPMWMAGVCLFYAWHAMSWISVRRLRVRGVCSAPPQWQDRLASLGRQLKVSRPVQLLESCLVNTPLVLGHFRPVILMPIGLLTGMPKGQIEAVLLHELAHVRRYDYLVNVLQRPVEGLLFYHPAVWWISHVIRTERENCCDDLVVEVSGDAHEYAMALAALEENRWPDQEPALAATGGNLVKRVRRLLYPHASAGAWISAASMAVIVAATTAVVLTAWQPPRPQAADAQKPMTPYEKWLNEDVLYLTSARERESFLLLDSDAEREKFIEQFWRQRDPTPGTWANEMKEEHYRRIAYANQRFWTSDTPGWRTDRGRVYIMRGPPDTVEAHLVGGTVQFATEVWMYQWFEGVGRNVAVRFIDRSGKGDFRIEQEPGR